MDKGVEVMQVETRNPHFHEDKGEAHLKEMINGSLGCIYHSSICHPKLQEKILEELKNKSTLDNNEAPPILEKINPFKEVNIKTFDKKLHEKATSLIHWN
jgi:mannosyl-3-phosphoglycerate synthase